MADALVTGHICIDLFPAMDAFPGFQPGKLVEIGPLGARPGGCVSNTGLDLASLGTQVRLVADAGDDALGRMLAAALSGPGVDATGVRLLEGASTSYSIVIEPTGADRGFWHHPGANAAFDGSAVTFEGERLLHLGYPSLLLPLLSGDGEPLRRLFAAAHARGVTTSLDLAVTDPDSEAGRRDWDDFLARVLPVTDVFNPSLDDLESCLGRRQDAREAAQMALDKGAAVVMLKAGSDGVYLRTGSKDRLEAAGAALDASFAGAELWAPSLEVGVAGTTGAGDAACAGLLHAILAGLGPQDAVRAAALAAGAKVGSQSKLPSWQDLAVAGTAFRPLSKQGFRPAGQGLLCGPAHSESS